MGIDCHRKRTRKRKLNALLAKRYGSTSHFFQNIVKNGEIIFKKFLLFCSIARGLRGLLLDISIDLIQVLSRTVVESRIWKLPLNSGILAPIVDVLKIILCSWQVTLGL